MLPIFGGTASVWSVVLVFFQGCLLAGYSICSISTARPRAERSLMVGYVFFIATSAFCSFQLSDSFFTDVSSAPLLTLLQLLVSAFLIPSIVLSSGSTLYQRCASLLGERYAGDPYRLYSISNVGSFMALFCYPLFIEPLLPLDLQREVLRIGSIVNAGVLGGIIAVVYLFFRPKPLEQLSQGRPGINLQWLTIPACSSALLIAVTMHVCTNVAPIPLLWAIPLFLFLLSYAIGFSAIASKIVEHASITLRIAVLLLLYCWLIELTDPFWLGISVYLLFFFVLCVALHSTLYQIRPATEALPKYYLFVAAGGFVGGCFVNFAAPLLFSDMYELPLLMCACTWALSAKIQLGKNRVVFLVLFSVVSFALFSLSDASSYETVKTLWLVLLGIAYVSDVQLSALAPRLLLIVLFAVYLRESSRETIYSSRNFYGTLKVIEKDGFRTLVHGVTHHGKQAISSRDECRPSSYYHPSGPAGSLLLTAQTERPFGRIGFIGVGSGALACYGDQNQKISLYEINPAILDIANNQRYFTYLSHAKHAKASVFVGDARTQLRSAESNSLDVLVIDAFNSDAIPVHLLTVEAIAEYLRVVDVQGVILLHLSNNYLDLKPVVAAGASKLGLESFFWEDTTVTKVQKEEGKDISTWALIGHHSSFLDAALRVGVWHRINARSEDLWTDQYSSVWNAFATN